MVLFENRLAKLDTKDCTASIHMFLPIVIALKNGKEVVRQSEAMSKEQIVQWVNSIYSTDKLSYDLRIKMLCCMDKN